MVQMRMKAEEEAEEEAAGGRAVLRRRRRRSGGRLAVVVAVQNVVVVVCVLVTVYVYWDAKTKTPSEDIPQIHFASITDVVRESKTLNFSHALSKNLIDFFDNTNKIYIRCTGPYMLHMDVCYKSLKEQDAPETELILQLQVENSKTPAESMKLQPSDEVCRGLHSIVYLRANEVASLHLNSTTVYSINNMTMSLSSLLGNSCHR